MRSKGGAWSSSGLGSSNGFVWALFCSATAEEGDMGAVVTGGTGEGGASAAHDSESIDPAAAASKM
jgi:hypothetical protein